jgi:hypothetical protein
VNIAGGCHPGEVLALDHQALIDRRVDARVTAVMIREAASGEWARMRSAKANASASSGPCGWRDGCARVMSAAN